MTLRYGGWAGALTGAGAGAIVGLLVGPGGAAAGASGGFLAGGVSGIIWGGLEGFIAAAAEDDLAGVAEGASKNGLKAGAVAGLAAGAGKALGKAIEKGVGLTFWQGQMGAGGTLTLERIIVHCPPALAAAVNGVTIVAQGGLVVLMKKMGDGELKMPEEGKKHNHHTVPNEIREKLPEHLRNDPDLKTTVPVDAKKHLKEVHDKTGISPKETGIFGGKYNKRFHDEIIKSGGYEEMTKETILRIRDMLMKEFGL